MALNIIVKSLSDFKDKAFRVNGDFVHFNIKLAGGLAWSGKRISYRPNQDQFLIIHEIDESYEEIYSSDLSSKSNFIEAIHKESLIVVDEIC